MSSLKLKHSGGNSVSLNPPSSAPTSSDVAFKLPNADGSAGQVLTTDGSGNLSWSTIGLPMVDEFRANADAEYGNNTTLTFWERSDTNFEKIGTGMTHSSGVFTFPTTGKYLINCHLNGRRLNDDQEYIGNVWELSTNGGSGYSVTAVGYTSADSSNAHFSVSISKILDVTDASNFRLYIRTNSANDVKYFGNTNDNRCIIQFIRLGDT